MKVIIKNILGGQTARLVSNILGGQTARLVSKNILAAVLSSLCALSASAAEPVSIQDFLATTHAGLLRKSPELFCLKMNKAVRSNADFFRAFPELFYLDLRHEDIAAELARTPVMLLMGDVHPKNLELIRTARGLLVPQFNDFDQAGRAPVGIELVRMLTSAALLGDEEPLEIKSALSAATEARAAYLEALDQTFKSWLAHVQEEKAIALSKPKSEDWADRVGEPLDRTSSARWAARLGINPAAWQAYDHSNGGLNSIGMSRLTFFSTDQDYVLELKQIKGQPALAFFTNRDQTETGVSRIHQAYLTYRQVLPEARTLALENREWIFRKRSHEIIPLALEYAKSSARVIGGLLAIEHSIAAHDAHLGTLALREAMGAITLDTVQGAALKVKAQRAELDHLLKSGEWGCNQL